MDYQQAWGTAGRPLVPIRGGDESYVVQATSCIDIHLDGDPATFSLGVALLPAETTSWKHLWPGMQTTMLVTAENFATRHHAFASGQMHAAMDAPNHILAFHGESVLLRFLPLFNPANIGSQRPENEHGNKGKKKQPTQRLGLRYPISDRNWSG